jgi:hypothetical protein
MLRRREIPVLEAHLDVTREWHSNLQNVFRVDSEEVSHSWLATELRAAKRGVVN